MRIVYFRFSTNSNRNPSTSEYSHAPAEEYFTSPTLDVTDLTAHCLRMESANEAPFSSPANDSSNAPARLILVGDTKGSESPERTAVRVWLVGQRPGRVRVKLAPVLDSPQVKLAMPTSLMKLRKQQLSQAKQNGWDAQQFQSLWVTVTDTDAVWPVGITAQLVTGKTMLTLNITLIMFNTLFKSD